MTFDYCLTLVTRFISFHPFCTLLQGSYSENIFPAFLPCTSFSVAPHNLQPKVLSLASEGLPQSCRVGCSLISYPSPALTAKWSLIIPQTEWKSFVTFMNLTMLFSLCRLASPFSQLFQILPFHFQFPLHAHSVAQFPKSSQMA